MLILFVKNIEKHYKDNILNVIHDQLYRFLKIYAHFEFDASNMFKQIDRDDKRRSNSRTQIVTKVIKSM